VSSEEQTSLLKIAKRLRESWQGWDLLSENFDGDGWPDGMTHEWIQWHLQVLYFAIKQLEVKP